MSQCRARTHTKKKTNSILPGHSSPREAKTPPKIKENAHKNTKWNSGTSGPFCGRTFSSTPEQNGNLCGGGWMGKWETQSPRPDKSHTEQPRRCAGPLTNVFRQVFAVRAFVFFFCFFHLAPVLPCSCTIFLRCVSVAFLDFRFHSARNNAAFSHHISTKNPLYLTKTLPGSLSAPI